MNIIAIGGICVLSVPGTERLMQVTEEKISNEKGVLGKEKVCESDICNQNVRGEILREG